MRLDMCALTLVAAAALEAAALAGTRNELHQLLAGDATSEDGLGSAVAVEGTKVVVGAPYNNDFGFRSGAAYVFDATSGLELLKLLPDDGAAQDQFGLEVAISGATIAVRGRDSAYLFDAATGAQIARLQPDSGGVLTGRSLAIGGPTVLVGGYLSDNFTTVVHVFDTATQVQTATLVPSGTGGYGFGISVAVDGDLAIVGAQGDDDVSPFSGSAYLFDLASGQQIARLVPEDQPFLGPHAFSNFAWSVGLSGDYAICGAYHDDENGTQAGAAYVYDATTGAFLFKLLPDDAEEWDHFGWSVGISGTTAIVGSPWDDDGGPWSGSAYLFDVTTGNQLAKLVASDGAEEDFAGGTVAIDGTIAVLGAYEDDDGALDAGAAYLFDAEPFLSFCDGADGALAACPCANPGAPDTGCEIQQATGGVGLEVVRQEIAPLNRATLAGAGFPTTGTPAAIVIRSAELDAAAPAVFGDGLRCVGTPLVRLGAAFAIGGVSEHTFGHGSMAGSGDAYYQLWFRNTPAMYCDPAAAFNLSNGRVLTW